MVIKIFVLESYGEKSVSLQKKTSIKLFWKTRIKMQALSKILEIGKTSPEMIKNFNMLKKNRKNFEISKGKLSKE